MSLAGTFRRLRHTLGIIGAAAALIVAPQVAVAQAAGAPAREVAASPAPQINPAANPTAGVVRTPIAPGPTPNPTAPAAPAADPSAEEVAPGGAAGAYIPLPPTAAVGMPDEGIAFGFQEQYSPIGEEALWMHNAILMPLIVFICLLVLGLLLYVVVRYRRSANTVPSKTSHNTVIEVIWTLLPVLILVAIAIPSIRLLAHQYEPAPARALTVKATGYQWYWGYTYPDNGGFEVISNMLDEDEAVRRGEPGQLAADNRMVVPAGEPIRIQTIGADVIHSFAVPSLWFKLDAVPGRINEKVLFIKQPGVYYGQCMELCGARHAYMPIVVEALPRPQFEAWVLAQGGTVGGVEQAEPIAAPSQQPESAIEGAPGAGANPSGDQTPIPPANPA